MSHDEVVHRAGLTVAGVALIAYPALRPWGAETGPTGVATFATVAWPVSHVLAMVGFVALAFAFRAVRSRAEVAMWLAVAFLLPYYGAEAHGLHALGRFAEEQGDAEVLAVADMFRYAPLPLVTFCLGLLALASVGAVLMRQGWAGTTTTRIGAVMAGVGLLAYLPQFFGTPVVRISHGIVLGCGLLLLAVSRTGRAE